MEYNHDHFDVPKNPHISSWLMADHNLLRQAERQRFSFHILAYPGNRLTEFAFPVLINYA
jgi:hypothetical protein